MRPIPLPSFARRRSTAHRLCVTVRTAACIVAALASTTAFGQTIRTWSGTTDNNWFTTTNWVSGTVSGTNAGTTSNNYALFNTNPTNKAPTWSSYLNLAGFTFDTVNVGSYTIGTTSGSAAYLTSGGTTQLTLTANASQTINAPLFILNASGSNFGSYLFLNSSSASTLTLGGAITGTATSGTTAITFTPNRASSAISVSGVISDGSGGGRLSLVKSGTGTLTLTGANTYSGPTTLNSGTTIVGNASAFGTGLVSWGGAAIGVTTGSSFSMTNNVLLAGSGTFLGSGSLNLTGTFTQSGAARTLTNNVASGNTLTLGAVGLSANATGYVLTVAGTGNTTFSGIISDGTTAGVAAGGLTISNTGTTTLSAANTYTGLTTLSAPGGVLALSGAGSLASTGTVTISGGGATFDISGASGSRTLGMLTGTAATSAVALGANGLAVGDATSGTYAGTIRSTGGGITKQGAGTFVLSGSNTYSGQTSINAGTLQIGSSGTTGSLNTASAITGSAGATLAFSRTNTITQGTDFASVIGGDIGVTQLSTGTLVLNGVNTYTGKTSIQNGTLSAATIGSVGGTGNLGAPTTAANATIDIGSAATGGVLLYTGAGETTDRVVNLAGTTGGATLDQSGSGLLKFSSAFTTTGAGSKTLTLQGSTAGTGEIAGAIVNNSATNITSLTKAGTGTWTLSGNNTYTGNTTVNGGQLNVTGVYTGGTAGSLFIVNNNGSATFDMGVGSASFYGDGYTNASRVGTSSASSTALLTLQSGTLSVLTRTGAGTSYGSLRIGGDAASANGTVVVNGGALNVEGRILMAANQTTSAGTLTINGGQVNIGTTASAYTTAVDPGNGSLWLERGTVVVNLNGGTLTMFGTRSDVSQQAGSAFNFNGGTLKALGNNATFLNPSAAMSVNVLAGGAIIDDSGFSVTIPRPLLNGGGGGGLTKLGSGTLALTGGYLYTGPTNINAGTLQIGTSGTLANAVTGAGGLRLTSGTLALSGTNTYSGPTTVDAGILTFRNTAADSAFSSVTVSGSAVLGLGVGGAGYFSSADVDSLFANTFPNVSMNATSGVGIDTTAGDFTYATSQSTVRGLTKLGANTLTLSGSNTFTGGVTVAEGTLRMGSANALGSTTAPMTMNGTLDLNGQNLTIGALSGSGTIGNNAGSGTSLVTINGTAAATFSGVLANNLGTPGGTLALASIGPGTQTLSGNNTYSGATTVVGDYVVWGEWNGSAVVTTNSTWGNYGTLRISGSLANTSGISISGGGTVIDGDATAASNNGITNRINSAATLTMGGTGGGGTFTMAAPAAGNTHSQSLASLAIGPGYNLINASAATGTTNLTFTGPAGSVYTRSTGGMLNVVPGTGVFNTRFTNTPSINVSGSGSNAILVGAFLNSTGFVGLNSGTLTAATYTANAAGSLTADANINMGSNTSGLTGVTSINSIRFNASGTAQQTVTLSSGTLVIASGGIISGTGVPAAAANATSGIYGGALTSGTNELFISGNGTINARTNFGFNIASQIVDNAAGPVGLNITGNVLLSNTANSFTGNIYMNSGVLQLSGNAAGRTNVTDGVLGGTNTIYATNGSNAIIADFGTTNPWTSNHSISIAPGANLDISTMSGPITVNASVTGSGVLGIGNSLYNNGSGVIIPVDQSGFTGTYSVGSFLRANEGVGLSSNANLLLAANSLGASGVLETSADMTRTLGSGPGQVRIGQIQGNSFGGGFSAVSGTAGANPVTVSLGGIGTPQTLTWGVGGFMNAANGGGNGSGLTLSNGNANNTLTWANPINNNGYLVQVYAAAATSGTATAATMTGAISGAGGFTKAGAGLLVLSATNTFTGKTSVLQGTLGVAAIGSVSGTGNLGAPTTVANATIDIGTGATAATLLYSGIGETTDRVVNLAGTTGGVTLDQSGSGLLKFSSAFTATGAGAKTLTLQGSTAGSGEIAGAIVNNSATNITSVTKAGTGTWTLSAANTYTGTTTVNGGVLAAGSANAFGSSSPLIVNSGTVNLGGFNQSVGALSGSAGTLITTSAATGTSTLTLTVGSGLSSTFAGSIADNSPGVIAVTKAGAGTQILSGTNTYSGVTTINAGTLQFATPASLYNGNTASWTQENITVESGATLGITVGAADAFTTGNVTTLLSNLGGLGGAVDNNGLKAGSNITFIQNAAGTFTVADNIADSTGAGGGSISVLKTGTAMLVLSGSNSFSGGLTVTTISTGENTGLTLANSSAAGSGTITMNGNAGGNLGVGLYLNDGVTVTNDLTFNTAGGRTTVNSVSGTSTYAGNIFVNSASNYAWLNSNGAGLLQITGNITGTTGSSNSGLYTRGGGPVAISGNVTLTNSSIFGTWAGGVLTLSGSNTFGTFDLRAGGTLNINSAYALGTSLVSLTGSPTLDNTSAGDITLAGNNNFTWGSDFTFGGTRNLNLGTGTSTISGTAANTVRTITVTKGTLAVGGPIIDSGSAFGITKSGTGTLSLAAANTYSGTTAINAGTLALSGAGTLGASTAPLSLGGGQLDLGGLSVTVGSVSGTAAFGSGDTIQNGTLTGTAFAFSNTTGTTTISAVLAGAAANFTKSGTGAMTLSAANTYGGTTAINAGTLQLGSGGTAGSLNTASVITGSAGATLAFNRSNTLTQGTDFNSVIGGGINVRQSGSGTVVLSSANTYTGTTTINSGVVSVSTLANGGLASGIGASTSAVGNLILGGGSLQYTGATVSTDRAFTLTASTTSTIDVSTAGTTLTFTGSTANTTGGLTKAGAGTLALGGTAAYTGNTAINAGTLQIGNGATAGAISTSSTIAIASGATLAFSRTDAYGGNFANAISGSGGITLLSGSLTFSTAKTYTGQTTVNGGVLLGGIANAFGSSAPLALNSGTVNINGFSQTVGALSGSAGTLITTSAASATRTLTTSFASGTSTFAGTIANNGSGIVAFTKSGAGTQVLSGSNSYTGATTITAGVLQLGSGNPSGVPAASTLTVNGGVFDLNGNNFTTNSLAAGNAAGTLTDNSAVSGTTTFTTTSLVASTAFAINDGANGRAVAVTLNNITNSNGTLTAANTFSGGLLLSGSGRLMSTGTSSVGTAGNIVSSPWGRGTITLGSGTADRVQLFPGTNNTTTILNDIVFNSAGGTDVVSAIRLDSLNNVLAGTLTAGLADINMASNGTGSVTLQGRLTGANGLWLRAAAGNLTVTLSNTTGIANDYQGITTIDAGQTLIQGAANQIPSGVGYGGMSLAGTFNIGGFSTTLNSLTGAGVVEAGGGTPVLTIGATGVTGTFSGGLRNTSGTLALVKSGTGTFTLSGSNSFSGTTSINAGTLAVSNANALRNSTLDLNALDSGTATFAQNSTLGGLTGSRDLDMGTRTLSIGNNGQSTTYSGALSNGGLTKIGAGTLTLSGNNSYTGANTVSAGTLVFSGSNNFNASTATFTVGGSGTFAALNISGGSTSGTGSSLLIGSAAGDRSVATISADTNFRYVQLSQNATSAGALNITAGTVLQSGGASVSAFSLGNSGGYGAVRITGGTVSAAEVNIATGASSTGVLDVLGGTLTATTWLQNGRASTGPINAVMNITGGTVTGPAAGTNQSFGAAASGTAIYNIGANGLYNMGTRVLTLNSNTGGSPTTLVTLAGGTMVTGQITSGGATSILNLNGGVLQAGAASSAFLNNLTGAYVYSGGGTINNGGFGITIGQNLLAASGTGISSINLSGSGSGYIGAPVVQISGGGGSGATAIAQFDPDTGTVTGITVTSPGRGYTSTPTVTLVGGGSLSAATVGSVATAAVTSGGLTFGGSGTTTLSGSNTYTGPTTLNAGTLVAGTSTNAFGSSAPLVLNAGTVNLNGFSQTIGSLSGSAGTQITTSTAAGTTTLTSSFASGTSTFAGTIANNVSGTVAFTKAGAGTQVLSGTNTFSGATSIAAGILSINGTSALAGTSGLTIAGGAGLTYTGGAANFNKNVTVTAGSGTGTIRNSGGGLLTLSGNLSKDNSVLRFTGGAFNVTGVISGATAGTSDLFVDDAYVMLSNTNTYDGPTYVFNSGTLALGVNNAIPNTSVVTLGDATSVGTLVLGSFTDSISQLVFSGSGGTLSLSGDKTAAAQLATAGSLTLGSNATLVLTGAQTSASLYRLISATSISGSFANTNISGLPSGYTLIYSSTGIDLQRQGDQSTTFTMTTGTVTRALVNTTVALSGSITNTSLAGSANLAVSLSSGGVLSVTGLTSGTSSVAPQTSTSVAGTLNAGSTVGSQSWSVINTDAGAITTTSTASGSLTVVNQRVFTTSTSTLNIGLVHAGASLGSVVVTSTGLNGTTANASLGSFTGGASGLTLGTTDPTAFNGGTDSQSATYSLSGAATAGGILTGTFTSVVSGEFGGIPNITVAVTGAVFSGTATWNAAGSGAWGSGASSNWTSAGGVGAAPGTFAGYGNTDVAIFAGSQSGISTVSLDGATPSLASLAFTNTVGSYLLEQGSGGSLTLDSASGKPSIDVAASALAEISTSIIGSDGLEKLGLGTLVLTGSNTFTGGTDILAGTLAVDGFLGDVVNVANGATLAGVGTVGGLVDVANGGTLSPGNGSPGTFIAGGGLSLADAAILNFQLSATNFTVGGGINDLVNVTGDLNLDGILNVSAIGGGDFSGVASYSSWRLFNYTGSNFANNGLNFGSMPSLGGGRYFQVDTSTVGEVNLVIVPEPGAIALAGIGLGIAGWLARRRRK